MSMTKFEYVFILFGMTGSGKSSSGNTLLDRDDCFETSISFNSCTRAAELACKEFSEYIINVVDTPGIFDTDQTVAQTLEIIYEGISQLVDGISAFLFVLKLGQRCTKEQNETIEAFKRSFGDSFVKNHCIIVLTGGDLCGDLNNDNIQEWCRRTENIRDGSDLKKLMIECDYRVVLFNNKDKTKRDASVDKLLNYFHPQAPRYTNETFQKCIDARNEYVTNLGFPGQRSDIQRQLSLLENDFDAMYQNKGEGEMDQIKDRAKKLMETVQNASAGTHKMDDLKFRINQIIEKTGKIPENGEARMKAIQDLKNEVRKLKVAGISTTAFSVIVIGGVGALLSVSVLPAALVGAAALGVLTIAGHAFYAIGKKIRETAKKLESKPNDDEKKEK
ncbi:unnamed protein product [Lymnaea stagnalis]|uniref:AIG1-type G domain-containing protein n=1 Tax=Lymnaea stagnalis TaxID=6523 RepID=A0AAV2H9E9_LYMST